MLHKQSQHPRRRMLLFSFGLHSLAPKAQVSTSPNLDPNMHVSAAALKSLQFSSPVCLPVLETEALAENPDTNIFERSVQDCSEVKQEDFIPPALDATATILGDKDTNLDEVEMVYLSRRNSSVIGLNMALGRPYTPLRKNSLQQMTPLNMANMQSLLLLTNQPQLPVSPPKLQSSRSLVLFYSYADMISNDEFSRRPLMIHAMSHSGTSTTPMRKMSVASNMLLGNGPSGFNGTSAMSPTGAGTSLPFNKLSRKLTLNLITSSNSQLQLSKQLGRNLLLTKRTIPKAGPQEVNSLNKFLISPESSDSEENDVYHPASGHSISSKRKLVSLDHSFGNESFVLTSVGDCIRQCTTEIRGN